MNLLERSCLQFQDIRDTSQRTDRLLTHVMNGGESRFNAFCDALMKTGQHEIVTSFLKPTGDVADASVSSKPVAPAVKEKPALGADVFLSRECQSNLRRNWNKLLCEVRADEELLGHLTGLKVFTDFQIKRLQVRCCFVGWRNIRVAG